MCVCVWVCEGMCVIGYVCVCACMYVCDSETLISISNL